MTTTLSGREIAGPVDPPTDTAKKAYRWGWVIYLVLIFFALIYLYPFLIQIGTSFKTDSDATASPLNPIPQEWTLDAYRSLRSADFPLWFMNSVIVTFFVTIGRVFFDSLARYALARLHFAGRRAMAALFIGIMAVPAVVLLIPKYLVLVQLGIYKTYLGMIIPLGHGRGRGISTCGSSLSISRWRSRNRPGWMAPAALLMTIPVAIVFFIFQRYFVRGASGGAVKG